MIKKKDFIEIEFTGKADGNIFDTNIKEQAKKINMNIEATPTVIIVGEGMLIKGFDKALEGKEIGKKYKISLSPKESFGERKREMIKTIPLSAFTEKQVNPQRGMTLLLDNQLVKIIAVSGGRVITDFNNPLSGKNIEYEFKIKRKITDEKEKISSLSKYFFKQELDFEVKDKILFKVDKKIAPFLDSFSDKFKKLVGKEIKVEEKNTEKETSSKK